MIASDPHPKDTVARMSLAPIFYDASGRRRRRFGFAVGAFIVLALLSAVALAVSIGAVPSPPLLPVDAEHPALVKLPPPHEPILKRTRREILRTARLLTGQPPRGVRDNTSLAIGFHVPWDESSAGSLRRNIGELDWLIPGWISITGPNHTYTIFKDPAAGAAPG